MGLWEPEIELELDEGERLIATRRHHWLLLARNFAIPLTVALVTGGIAVSRMIGVGLFGFEADKQGAFDWINILLLLALGALLVVWVRSPDARKKKSRVPIDISWLIGAGALILIGLFAFRYRGGRLLEINAEQATTLDLFNVILLTIATIATLALMYIFIDWRNDALILTSTRVIVFKDELLVRIEQQQILLVDVQQVLMKQNTYPQAIFGYGSITIQSFSLRKLYFDFVTGPQQMEQLIKDELGKTRKAVEPNLVRRLVEERVFENKARSDKPKPVHIEIHGADRQGLLAWLFPANPLVDSNSGQVTWRPSSVYVGLLLVRPLAIWLVTSAIYLFLLVASSEGLVWGGIVWVIVTLICAAWIFWIREEHVNDVYILNRREIIDVDQQPFGPINRRSAPIGNIQSVTLDASFVEQMLGYGTVQIQTGGTGEFSFNHVPDPRGVQGLINDYLTDFKRGADERALQNSLDIFKEYHALQRDKGELVDASTLGTAIDERARALVDDYANNTAPIQIEYHLRRAARRAALLERRARIRQMVTRRRNNNP
jgi:hypothetical protein